MHYYKFNIGDYRRDTAHLSHLEHGIYRALIDSYMLDEKPLSADIKEIERKHMIRTSNEKKALRNVLSDFFIFENEGFFNARCDEVISSYNEKSLKASKSAKVRWEKDANALRTDSEQDANHKPLTINHKPLNIPQDINPTSWKEFEDHRKQMRKPLSDLARTKAMNVIKEFTFDQQAAIIDKSIQSRWAGLFPEKSYEKNQPTNRPAESHHAGVVRMLRTRIETSNTDT